MSKVIHSFPKLNKINSHSYVDQENKKLHYANVRSYHINSTFKHKGEINISSYINIYDNSFASGYYSDTSIKKNSQVKAVSKNKSGKSNSVTISSPEDNSDCECAEVGNPEMNYYEMDMRNVSRPLHRRHQRILRKLSHGDHKLNNQTNTQTIEKQNQHQQHEYQHHQKQDDHHYYHNQQQKEQQTNVYKTTFSITKSDSLSHFPWRRRSLTVDTAELDKRRHSTLIYADLVINSDCFGNHENHTADPLLKPLRSNEINYLKIDLTKTEALYNLDQTFPKTHHDVHEKKNTMTYQHDNKKEEEDSGKNLNVVIRLCNILGKKFCKIRSPNKHN